jgi:hypothetical protein
MFNLNAPPPPRGEFARRVLALASLTLIITGASGAITREAVADPLFGPKTDFVTGTTPYSVAIGDLNGDGKPDLAVTNYGPNTVSVLLGNGDGTFGAQTDYGTGSSPFSVAVGDLNGDGKPDLVTANTGSSTVSVLLGSGDGTFGPKSDYAAGGGPLSVAVGDLNGDGKLDLAVTDYVPNTVSVLLGNGDGTFGAKTDYGTGEYPHSVAIADLNGDGKPDLAVANDGGNSVSVLLGSGDGTFGPKSDYATGTGSLSVAVGDLNGDGKPDLAVANYASATASVLLGNGNGTFGTKSDYGMGMWPWWVAMADLDGDGNLDLGVVNRGSNTVSILLGIGDGTFEPKSDYETGSLPRSVAIADLDGTGRPDLAVANEGSNTVSVLLNTLGTPSSTSLASTPNPSVFGQTITLTAAVTPDTATGVVEFHDGSTPLGNASLTDGAATLPVSGLSKAIHSLTARYLGDAVHGGSVSAALVQTINSAGTSTMVTASVNPSLFRQAVSFAATVTVTPPGAGSPAGTVQFKIDEVDFGWPVALTNGTAMSAGTDTLSVGLHDVQAVYSGDGNFNGSASPILADTVLRSGPVIVAVRDVPNDQGGRVFLTWRCILDQPGNQIVTGYRIWRRVPTPAAVTATQRDSSDGLGAEALHSELSFQEVRAVARHGSVEETFWEAIATLPTAQLVSYGYTASTTQDSIAGSNPYTAFFVQALTADPFVFYSSAPDSGYSVDNLSPPTPVPFVATYSSSSNTLHWTASRAPDLREFRLYRGPSPDFVPSPSNLVVATRDTGYVDAPGSVCYKLVAVDVHGNASRFALVSPDGPIGVLASLVQVNALIDRIELTWYTAGSPSLRATVYRREGAGDWRPLGVVTADGRGYLRYTDGSVMTGTRYGYRLGIMDGGEEVFAGEVWVTAEQPRFWLAGASPNPAHGGRLTVDFVLPTGERAQLELFDVTGRRVAGKEVGSMGPGQHTMDLSQGLRVPPGLYLVRLAQGANVRVTRMAVLW